MKKRILSFLVVLCLVLGLSTTAFANEDYSNIYEGAGLLSTQEAKEINEKAAAVSEYHNSGIYIFVVDDIADYGYDDIYDFGRENYLSNGLGMGEEYSGVMLVLSMSERDYTIVVSGETMSKLFDNYNLDRVCDAMLDNFADNDWYGGFYDYIVACDKILEEGVSTAPDGYESTYSDATNYEYEEYTSEDATGIDLFDLLVILIVPSVIAAIVCFVFASQMKSVKKGTKAEHYISEKGFVLSQRSDIFTHVTQVRNKIKTSSSSGGGSRSSGSFSGRSGKF